MPVTPQSVCCFALAISMEDAFETMILKMHLRSAQDKIKLGEIIKSYFRLVILRKYRIKYICDFLCIFHMQIKPVNATANWHFHIIVWRNTCLYNYYNSVNNSIIFITVMWMIITIKISIKTYNYWFKTFLHCNGITWGKCHLKLLTTQLYAQQLVQQWKNNQRSSKPVDSHTKGQ